MTSRNNKNFKSIWILLPAVLILQCEGSERFYRPDMPEQMCSIGLIDIDDTLSYGICNSWYYNYLDRVASSKKIYFEKSFQSDLYDGTDEPFVDFDFKILKNKEEVFNFNKKGPWLKKEIDIPAEISFETGSTYTFKATERRINDIQAECTVPDPPSIPTLVSVKKGINTLDLPKEGCYYWVLGSLSGPVKKDTTTYTRRSAEINFSFKNTTAGSFYAIFLIGSPYNRRPKDGSPGWQAPNFMNYELLECNSPGFFNKYKGGFTVQHYCKPTNPYLNAFGIFCMTDTLNVFFIKGDDIPGGDCNIKISTYWDNVKYIPGEIEYFRIRLLSIPKEAYQFYKSIYTAKVHQDDPFAELVNINGNVVGGNGVIALCRSKDLIVYTGQKGGMYDSFF